MAPAGIPAQAKTRRRSLAVILPFTCRAYRQRLASDLFRRQLPLRAVGFRDAEAQGLYASREVAPGLPRNEAVTEARSGDTSARAGWLGLTHPLFADSQAALERGWARESPRARAGVVASRRGTAGPWGP